MTRHALIVVFLSKPLLVSVTWYQWPLDLSTFTGIGLETRVEHSDSLSGWRHWHWPKGKLHFTPVEGAREQQK